MNFHLVEDWMKKVFVPEVKRYQEAIGKTGKVLLLIDNAPAHPVIDLLNSVDELVTVKFFPPNVISSIQLMDQGVIRSFKGLYRKNLLRKLLMKYDNTAESVTAFNNRWLGCDSEDQNFQMMNDEEIVESPTRRKTKKSSERRKQGCRLSLRIMLLFDTSTM
uniref:DDE-1 domain-containing protein n=1 Tax=Trichuris muris TaxID=70415 RepID=A0A5S6R290_TRIMR